MPMFDDPRKELNRLQAELLAEEEEYQEDIWQEEEIHQDFEEELDDIIELIRDKEPRQSAHREPAYRNFANNYGRSMSEELLEEDVEDDDSALYSDEYYNRGPKKKEKGIRGLVFLAILETLGILAIAAWWVKFLWL